MDVRVRVEFPVFVPEGKFNVAGLNEADIPVGKADVTHNSTIKLATDVPLFTVIGKVIDPAVPEQSATGSVTVIFTASDECGNSASTTATFIIADNTPPNIDAEASNATAECDGNGNTAEIAAWLASNGGAAASDVCGNVTWDNNYASTAPSDDCGATGSVTVIFTATDDCGNSASTTATFTIEDNTAPTVGTEASDYVAECDGSGNLAELTAWLDSNGGASASDICGDITWENNSLTAVPSVACGNSDSVYVSFTVRDACGNSSTTSASFVIKDLTAPTIDTEASNATAECDGSGNIAELNAWLASNGGASASDICGSVTWGNSYSSTAPSDECGATGSVTVIFTASDGCGNSSSTSATFTIEDTTDPTLSACPNDIVLSACTETATWTEPTANDDCSATIVTRDGPAPGSSFANGTTQTITYTGLDDCGRSSSCSFTVTRAAELTVDAGPNENTYYGFSGDQSVTHTATASGGTGELTYTWTVTRPLICNVVNSVGDESFSTGGTCMNNACGLTPSCQGQTITATLIDTGDVCVTVTDADGCTATDCFTIFAEDVRCFPGKNTSVTKLSICHQTGSSSNPCATICVDEGAWESHVEHGDFVGKCPKNGSCTQPLREEELTIHSNDASLTAYPNPNSGLFMINFSGNEDLSLQILITNTIGQTVYNEFQVDFDGYIEKQLDLSALEEGVYYLQILNGEERYVQQIVIAR